VKEVESKYKTYRMRSGDVVTVEKAIDTGAAIHYYFIHPQTGKPARVIKLKKRGA